MAVRVQRLNNDGMTEVPTIRMAVPPHTICFRRKNRRRAVPQLTGPQSKRQRTTQTEPMLSVTAYYDNNMHIDWVPMGVAYDGLAYPEQVKQFYNERSSFSVIVSGITTVVCHRDDCALIQPGDLLVVSGSHTGIAPYPEFKFPRITPLRLSGNRTGGIALRVAPAQLPSSALTMSFTGGAPPMIENINEWFGQPRINIPTDLPFSVGGYAGVAREGGWGSILFKDIYTSVTYLKSEQKGAPLPPPVGFLPFRTPIQDKKNAIRRQIGKTAVKILYNRLNNQNLDTIVTDADLENFFLRIPAIGENGFFTGIFHLDALYDLALPSGSTRDEIMSVYRSLQVDGRTMTLYYGASYSRLSVVNINHLTEWGRDDDDWKTVFPSLGIEYIVRGWIATLFNQNAADAIPISFDDALIRDRLDIIQRLPADRNHWIASTASTDFVSSFRFYSDHCQNFPTAWFDAIYADVAVGNRPARGISYFASAANFLDPAARVALLAPPLPIIEHESQEAQKIVRLSQMLYLSRYTLAQDSGECAAEANGLVQLWFSRSQEEQGALLFMISRGSDEDSWNALRYIGTCEDIPEVRSYSFDEDVTQPPSACNFLTVYSDSALPSDILKEGALRDRFRQPADKKPFAMCLETGKESIRVLLLPHGHTP